MGHPKTPESVSNIPVKATQRKLNALHDMLADYFTAQLESGDDLSSGTLAQINAFLKNNNVTADITESKPMNNLTMKIKEILTEEADEA